MKRLLLLVSVLFVVTSAMAQFNVTFNVDISGIQGFNPDTTDLYMAGDFLGWEQPGSNPAYMMTVDPVDPNIYTLVWEFLDGETVALFKYFLIYNGEPSWANGEWEGDPNRVAVFIGETTLDQVWADKPSTVTFNVDMTNATEFNPETDDVYIAGDLANGWAQPGTIGYYMMQPVVGKEVIYTIDLLLYHSDYMYKYFRVIDSVPSWDYGEWTGDPNRTLTVDTTMIVDDVWAVINPGINEFSADMIESLYPNPCQSFINIVFPEKMNDIDKIEVYNSLGEVVHFVDGFSLQKEVKIYTGNLNNGIYFISIHGKRGVQTAKFIKK